MKKFYVTGMVKVKKVSKDGMSERESVGSFDRVVYAEDAVAARDMVYEAVKAKWTAEHQIYSVSDFKMLSIEVFEQALREEDADD